MLELNIALLIFLLPLAYSPGPGNMFFAAIGARFGAKASIPASIGYHSATWLVTALIGLGFAEIARLAPVVFQIIKYAGVAYILWLAWTFIRAGSTNIQVDAKAATAIDGAVLLLLNPKAYLIVVLMFTQFLNPDSSWMLVIWITTLFTVNNLIAFAVWAVAGDMLTRRFRTESQARRLNLVFGLLLAGVALWMLFQ